jgi:acetyl esterase
MPLDPDAQRMIDLLAANPIPAIETLAPGEARRLYNLAGRVSPGQDPVAAVVEFDIPGPAGGITARRYVPTSAAPNAGLLFFHGGGWVVGNLDTHDAICRAIASRSGCQVVSVDYRMAPEAKFPAPLEDCYAALSWVAGNAASLDLDPDRLAVGGDSAGGNLAAAVALLARKRGGPSIRFQCLLYPVTDHGCDTASYRESGNSGYVLTTGMMTWFWRQYLEDGVNPLASVLRAPDLTRLPPALVITAEYDPLRDEGEAYAQRLKGAGVPVHLSRYDGVFHGFISMAATILKGQQALDEVASELRRGLERR